MSLIYMLFGLFVKENFAKNMQFVQIYRFYSVGY